MSEELLPSYDADVPLFFGTEVIMADKIYLQCDKYRDMHTIDIQSSGRIDIVVYGHDAILKPRIIGSIMPQGIQASILRILRGRRVDLIVDTKFAMQSTESEAYIYCEFVYEMKDWYWKVRYTIDDTLRDCLLYRNGQAVATFVPDGKYYTSSVRLLGKLFMPCIQADWPVEDKEAQIRPEKFDGMINYHTKDEDVEVMRVTFLALWYRILHGNLARAV